MWNRRDIIKRLAILGLSPTMLSQRACSSTSKNINQKILLSTWSHEAMHSFMQTNHSKLTGLDEIEKAVNFVEDNPDDMSVGLGGRPDRNGKVTLDACIMDSKGNAGSVSCMSNYKNAISVARKVMEETPHVSIVGPGAEKFAASQGFEKVNLLTAKTKKVYLEWLKTSQYKPIINIENHDTIGVLSLDKNGNLTGGCSTSGLAYKMPGRVGDSSTIGSGLFVDNDFGAVTATGTGELILKVAGAYAVLSFMKQGLTPQESCRKVIAQIVKKYNTKDHQVAFIALSKHGDIGAYAIHPGFYFTKTIDGKVSVNQSDSNYK